jgi:hypothetical protein
MKVYLVIGTAPLHMGPMLVAANAPDSLVSFVDYPKCFKQLDQLTTDIFKKKDLKDEQRHHQS